MVQGELFRDDTSSSGIERIKKSFLSRHQVTLSLDKILLVFIAVLVVFALTYSFGVEHGKRAMEKNLESLIPTHTDTVSLHVENVKPLPTTNPETVLLVNQPTEEMPLLAPLTIETASIEPMTINSTTLESAPDVTVPQVTSPTIPTVDLSKKGSFTIQLVTYADEAQAVKEIKRLKANGHEGFVITSGHFYQVCANYFEDKSKAKSFLKRFSDISRYPDAYIRPVVR